MAYDEDLADRIREIVATEAGLTERRMFGGLAFLLDGNMAVAAGSGGALMVRVDREHAEELLTDDVRPMVMSGRELRGWLLVPAATLADDSELAAWVARGVRYTRTLPAKG